MGTGSWSCLGVRRFLAMVGPLPGERSRQCVVRPEFWQGGIGKAIIGRGRGWVAAAWGTDRAKDTPARRSPRSRACPSAGQAAAHLGVGGWGPYFHFLARKSGTQMAVAIQLLRRVGQRMHPLEPGPLFRSDHSIIFVEQ